MEHRALIVGVDFTSYADSALAWAVAEVHAHGGRLYLVHVVTQAALDATGALSLVEKRAAALHDLSRRLMQRARDAASSLLADQGLDVDVMALDLALEPRIVEGHATRAEGLVAKTIAQAASDLRAEQIVLGRRGRPDSVFDSILQWTEPVTTSEATPSEAGPLRLRLRQDAGLVPSARWGARSPSGDA